ncbi:MAG TPA: hypothetical protein VID67_04515 [Rhizomicrobium sp.]|jgi:hypothetical protein
MKSEHRIANKLFAATFVVIAFSAVATSPLYADDSWKGPGWYQVFDDTEDIDDGGEITMIWTGPYPNEAACVNYVKQKFADPAYVQSMIAKYGSPNKDWTFSCSHLDEDLPD